MFNFEEVVICFSLSQVCHTSVDNGFVFFEVAL